MSASDSHMGVYLPASWADTVGLSDASLLGILAPTLVISDSEGDLSCGVTLSSGGVCIEILLGKIYNLTRLQTSRSEEETGLHEKGTRNLHKSYHVPIVGNSVRVYS